MKGDFREWKVVLYLDADLYSAHIKVQSDRNLGKSYAGLLLYVEGMYQLGYIPKDVYEFHKNRYSQPLKPKTEPGTLADKKQKQLLERAKRDLQGMVDQFDYFKDNQAWLASARTYAERFSDLNYSKQLLGMIEKAGNKEVK